MRYVLARPRLLSLTPSARSHHTRPQPARSHWTPFLSPYFPPALGPTRAHHACLTVAPQGRGTRVHRLPQLFLGLNRLGCSRRAWDGPGSPTAMLFAMYFVLSVCA